MPIDAAAIALDRRRSARGRFWTFLARHLRCQNPVAIMREHRRMPHRIIDPKTHEPAEQ